MKPPCSALLAVAAILAVAGPPALAGSGSNEAIYTWVDAHGVRHYSDKPGSPNARILSFTSSGAPHSTPMTQSPAPTATTARHPSHTRSAPAPATMSPVERAALCTKLRAEVKRLEPVRRLQVNKNGSSRYLSGDDLVAFKKKMQQKMEVACAPQSQP